MGNETVDILKYEHFTCKSINLTHILYVHCSLWQFLLFLACFSITVIPVKRQSQA